MVCFREITLNKTRAGEQWIYMGNDPLWKMCNCINFYNNCLMADALRLAGGGWCGKS